MSWNRQAESRAIAAREFAAGQAIKPALVYVLTTEFDTEGEMPRGVFATEASAKREAEEAIERLAWPATEWKRESGGQWRLSWGASHFIVRTSQVNP